MYSCFRKKLIGNQQRPTKVWVVSSCKGIVSSGKQTIIKKLFKEQYPIDIYYGDNSCFYLAYFSFSTICVTSTYVYMVSARKMIGNQQRPTKFGAVKLLALITKNSIFCVPQL